MSKIIIEPHYLQELAALDAAIAIQNRSKLRIIFQILGKDISRDDFDKLALWDLILVSVMDKQMAVQLNKLSAYMPNLKFVVDPEQDLFTLSPGSKSRRVWKERS